MEKCPYSQFNVVYIPVKKQAISGFWKEKLIQNHHIYKIINEHALKKLKFDS